jgi:hypothetical protein
MEVGRGRKSNGKKFMNIYINEYWLYKTIIKVSVNHKSGGK